MAKKTTNVNTEMFFALKVAELSKVPVMFLSNPGIGKSTTVNLFAKVRGYEVILLRGNSTTAESVIGYDVAPKEASYEHKMAAIHLRPSWFEDVLRKKAEGKKTLLFLDELTTAHESVQSALLQVIFDRRVDSEYLPDDTLIIAAGNYAQNLSNTMNLLPPIMNRFLIYNITPSTSDLSIFLNKYKDCIINSGKRKDYFQELEETMRKLDSQEIKISESEFNMAGECVEKGLTEIMGMLSEKSMTVDFAITELQNIYVENYNNKVYGFPTYRSLCYLRDITLVTYKCFGKAGIYSDTYRNFVDGLCGVGISKKKSTKDSYGDDVTITLIGSEICDTMKKAINDAEKLHNDELSEFENFFKSVIKESESTKTFTDPQLQAILNKFEEFKKNKNVSDIETPISPVIISKLSSISAKTAKTLTDGVKAKTKASVDSDKDIFEENGITPDAFVGKVTTWNRISELADLINKFVNDPNKNYNTETKNSINSDAKELTQYVTVLKLFKKFATLTAPGLSSIIPEIKE